jgi:hypothetical protein
VDSLIKTLHMADLEPGFMTIRSLALTKAMPINTAVIVDLQPTEFDIIIMSEGIAQPIRTIALPNQELSWEQKLDMITADLDRTIKFFDTNNPEKPLDPKLPVHVSGELLDKPELHKSLAEKIGRPIQTISPVLKVPEQVHLGRYIVNIAMTIEKTTPEREPTFPVANMNLTPAPYQPKPPTLAKLVGIPAGVTAAALIVPLVMLIQSTSGDIEAAKIQLDHTNQSINQKNAQRLEMRKNISSLEKQVADIKAASENLRLSVNNVLTHQEWVNNDLKITLGQLMPGITLTSVSEDNGILTLSGTAPTESDVHYYAQVVLGYAKQLDLSKRYSMTTVSSLNVNLPETTGGAPEQTAPQGTINFTLTFERSVTP